MQGARAVGYVNAGTWEFLVDRQDAVYFMEVNTRIQVEHPVTEAISRLDRSRPAAGGAEEPLPWRQEQIKLRGHAIECTSTPRTSPAASSPIAVP